MRKPVLFVLFIVLLVLGLFGSPFVETEILTVDPLLSGLCFGALLMWGIFSLAKKLMD